MMEEIDPKWGWFLTVYNCFLAMYGIVTLAVLFNMLSMWRIRKRFPPPKDEEADPVTNEKQIANKLKVSNSVLSEGSVSSNPSIFPAMSNISSITNLDASSLDNDHTVEPVILIVSVVVPNTLEGFGDSSLESVTS
ncbi:uncharacterized protein [Argopecten irradians]|uniref:uncharacterized protein n=1 Tax=Argopecten irradians TaxID=31199 RepID=UPI00371A9D9B